MRFMTPFKLSVDVLQTSQSTEHHGECDDQKHPTADVLAPKNLSIPIKKGERIGVAGLSASGKSTLLRYFLQGLKDIKILSGARDEISYCSEDHGLFSGSVSHNIDPTCSINVDIIRSSFQAVKNPPTAQGPYPRRMDHSESSNTSPLRRIHLDTILDMADPRLTLAQRQLIALARTIAHYRSQPSGESKAQVVILDDPTCSLDSMTNAAMQRLIRREFKSCTVIIASNDLANILDYDRIVVMKSGEVVEIGSPEELLWNNHVDGLAGLLDGGLNAKVQPTKVGYNWEGVNRDGFDESGFDQAGFDIFGLDRDGFDKDGYNAEGLDVEGRTPEIASATRRWTQQCHRAAVIEQNRKREVAAEVRQRMVEKLGEGYDEMMPSGMRIYIATIEAKVRKQMAWEQGCILQWKAGRARVREFAAPDNIE